MSDAGEDVRAELEALEITYEAIVVEAAASGLPAAVTLPLRPRNADEDHEMYVALTLHLTAGPSYPAAPPGVAVADVKGVRSCCRPAGSPAAVTLPLQLPPLWLDIDTRGTESAPCALLQG